MSGPKDYSPPPRYSIQVFDGQLNEVFQLQSKLKQLVVELRNACIEDKNLNLYFDCQDELKSMESEISAALKRLEFNYRGSFGQDTYNKILIEIQKRMRELKVISDKCSDVLDDFHRKESDYKSYSVYHESYNQSQASFNSFKEAVGTYLKNNTPEDAGLIYTDAQSKLNLINFELAESPFELGFNAKAEALINTVVSKVLDKEKEVNAIRMEFNNQLLEKYPHVKVKSKLRKLSKEVEDVSSKILRIIASGIEPEIASKYRTELEDLQQSDSLKDVFYYQQLHDRILKSEKSNKNKEKIQELLISLNSIQWHEKFENEKNKLIQYCLELLNKVNVDSREVTRAQEKEKELRTKNDIQKEEEDILENERIFLKSQIINSLENMGYEVMDDLEVIDFEKADDLLLKCKDKTNFLNLKFKEDGSVKYCFQIPENKESLSENEMKYKLSQMDETCDDFQKVLSDLVKMGLKMELTDAKPTSEKWLLSITEKQKTKLKTQKRKSTTKKDNKKYLD